MAYIARITLSDEAIERFMQRASVRLLRKAVLRGNDCAMWLVLDNLKIVMDRHEPQFMKPRRARGLMKDYMKLVRRLHARFIGVGVRSEARAGRAALALELGGVYEQWVHDYVQMRSTQRRGETPTLRTVAVGEHRRTRTEKPVEYLQKAMTMTAGVMMIPTSRAVEAVFAGYKVPQQRTLVKGLRNSA